MTTILLLKRNRLIYGLISHKVHFSINTPQKHYSKHYFLNMQTVQALHLYTIPPIDSFFVTQQKKSDFSANPHNMQFFLSLTPIPFFKNN